MDLQTDGPVKISMSSATRSPKLVVYSRNSRVLCEKIFHLFPYANEVNGLSSISHKKHFKLINERIFLIAFE